MKLVSQRPSVKEWSIVGHDAYGANESGEGWERKYKCTTAVETGLGFKVGHCGRMVDKVSRACLTVESSCGFGRLIEREREKKVQTPRVVHTNVKVCRLQKRRADCQRVRSRQNLEEPHTCKVQCHPKWCAQLIVTRVSFTD